MYSRINSKVALKADCFGKTNLKYIFGLPEKPVEGCPNKVFNVSIFGGCDCENLNKNKFIF
jgi:hypothetical protein